VGYRVILAEDSPDIRDLMRLHLTVDGRFEVVAESENGDDVLELVRREQPDVLISDMSLEGTSGVNLIQALRDECPTCKILVFSGYASATPAAVSQAGADRVLEKTVDSFEDVVVAAATLCEVG
jgi:DNA-binding NarL/FixJ family response regulator